jgi:hypothetical protein
MNSKTEDILTLLGVVLIIVGVLLIYDSRIPEPPDFLKQENAVIEEIPLAPPPLVDEWPIFFRAILEKENGPPSNPLQITPAFWKEGCEYGDLKYDYSWRANFAVSCEVSKCYLMRYAPVAREQKDWFRLACIFRKGFTGQNSQTAKEYATRVVALMGAMK